MRIVVDTNIAFSAALNTDSKICRILLQPKTRFNFYSTEHLLEELNNHRDKLLQLTEYTDYELDRIISLVTNRIRFINVRLIPNKVYEKAENLCSSIDIDDTEFVALTNHIKGKFWSGDKELKDGLIQKNWQEFITTEELFKIVQNR